MSGAIKINGTSSGSTTITAPASGGDETIELSTALAAKAAAADVAIRQVIMGTSTTSTTIATTTYTDTTLSASITPSSASNKILIIVSQSLSLNRGAAPAGGGLRLLRDSTVIHGGDQLYEEELYVGSGGAHGSRGKRILMYLDSPSSTSAVTYKTQAAAEDTSSSGNVIAQQGNIESTIILMEVAA